MAQDNKGERETFAKITQHIDLFNIRFFSRQSGVRVRGQGAARDDEVHQGVLVQAPVHRLLLHGAVAPVQAEGG